MLDSPYGPKLEEINAAEVPKSDLQEAREALDRCVRDCCECCGLSGHLEWALSLLEWRPICLGEPGRAVK